MAIYSNGIKYGMAGYGKEFVGGDLVWQNAIVLKPKIAYDGFEALGQAIYSFDYPLGEIKNGIKINWYKNVPVYDSLKNPVNEDNYYVFDKSSATDSQILTYAHIKDILGTEDVEPSTVVSKQKLNQRYTLNANPSLPVPLFTMGKNGTENQLPLSIYEIYTFQIDTSHSKDETFSLATYMGMVYPGMDSKGTQGLDISPLIDSVEFY